MQSNTKVKTFRWRYALIALALALLMFTGCAGGSESSGDDGPTKWGQAKWGQAEWNGVT